MPHRPNFIFIMADDLGYADLGCYGGRAPISPNLDRMAGDGTLGRIDTIPAGLKPGSDVANLSVLGYDPVECYAGRGPLEAANMGVSLGPDDIAFRCNLVTLGPEPDPAPRFADGVAHLLPRLLPVAALTWIVVFFFVVKVSLAVFFNP